MSNLIKVKQENSNEINEIEKLCCVCMQKINSIDDEAKNIYKNILFSYEISLEIDDDKGSLLLSDALKMLTNLKFSENDGFPHLICNHCEQRLIDAIALKHQAAETFKCLSKIVENECNSSSSGNTNVIDNNYNNTTEEQSEYGEVHILENDEDDDDDGEISEYFADNNDDDNSKELDPNDDNTPTYQITEYNEIEDAVTFQHKNDMLVLEKLKNLQQKYKSSTTTTTTTKNSSTITISDINYEERKHFCNVCQKKFLRRSNLIDHLRLHANQKLFQCKFCDKSFVQAGNLKSHMRIHTKERPFVCQICKRSYNQSSALKVHYRSHTNERNYSCDECSKAFTNSSDLKKHERVHNPDLMYKCEMCPKLFAQRGNLKNHMIGHHNVILIPKDSK